MPQFIDNGQYCCLCLRRINELQGPSAAFLEPAPVVVGIDDWAITRGHRYGTIVVDLERRRPIEVLDGRESTNVADWLKRHPSIQVVARDRAGAYSDAAQRVIPHAQQVADRWHLLGNLRETVERLLLRHNARLREAAQLQLVAVSPLPQTQPAGADSVLPLMAWQKLSIDRRAARLGRYEEVVRLRAQGLSCKAIGRAMDLDQRTVSHFVRSGEYPERSPRGSGPMLLDAYRHYLCQRVAQGCTNITAVWHELQAHGFKGSRGTVRVAMAHAYAVSSSTDTAGRPGRRASTPSAQRAYAWWVGWDERGNQVPKRAEHRQFVEALCAIEPQIAEVSSLAREFLGLTRRPPAPPIDPLSCCPQSSGDSALCGQHDSGSIGGAGGLRVALEQRAGRRPNQPTEIPQASDVWSSKSRPAPRSRPASKLMSSAVTRSA